MPARFYAPDASRPGQVITLPADEAAHLTRVLRLDAGATVRVFDGRGHEFEGQVERAGKTVVEIALVAARDPMPEPRISVTLAQAVLKGDKMDDVVRDAVMLGVTAIMPMVTARTEVTVESLARAHRRERWERIAIGSAKQCGRAVVPRVFEPAMLPGVIEKIASGQLPQPAILFVEPQANAAGQSLDALERPADESVTVLVGPEGGWTPEEIARASEAMRAVTLRVPTIRADAMPVVGIAALFARWREL